MDLDLDMIIDTNDGEETLYSIAVDKKPPALFALMIGIDVYKRTQINPLNGAVRDATAVKRYLEGTLGVPPAHIKTLFNEDATRNALISELRAFETDDRIQEGDAIVIFYAGHGGTAPAPKGWKSLGNKIQMLIPHDYGDESADTEVHGLPDRTIAAILNKIAKEKGDNITVILDCCYAGSGTRSEESNQTRLVRGFEIPTEIPEDVDRSIWDDPSNRLAAIPTEFLRTGLSSHILLAACGANERAREEFGRGHFTKALLDTLITVGADEITYTELIERIPILPLQNPQCEGNNRGRICFGAKASDKRRVLHRVYQNNKGYIMAAGAANGITTGTVFTIYSEERFKEPLGTLIASNPSSFATVLNLPRGDSQFDIKGRALALQVRAGQEADLRLHIATDAGLQKIYKSLTDQMETMDTTRASITLVEVAKAQLDIALEGEHLVFNILDPLVTQYGLTRIPFRPNVSVGSINTIVHAAAHYSWQLRRSGYSQEVSDGVKIEFKELESTEEYDRDLEAIMRPIGENLVQAGVVDVIVNEDTKYGIEVRNESQIHLYPSVFFFDNSDLSISDYYQPATARGKLDVPLPPGESLTIGYGSGGGAPISFTLRDGQDVDVGFLKVFLTTKPVDLTSIPQESPFESIIRNELLRKVRYNVLWHTLLVPIVQRSAKN